MTQENEQDLRIDESSEYSVREYQARLKLLAQKHLDRSDIQEFINDQLTWTDGMQPEDKIFFEEDQSGILHPTHRQTLGPIELA